MRVGAVVVIVLIAVLSPGVVTASDDRASPSLSTVAETDVSQKTVTGLGRPMPTEDREDAEEVVSEAATLLGRDVPTNFAELYLDGELYILATDEPVQAGKITATGTVVEANRLSFDVGIMFGASVSVSRDPDTSTTVGDLRNNTDQYIGELVAVEGTYRSFPYAFTADTIQTDAQFTVSALTDGRYTVPSVFSNPYQGARWSTLNLSGTEYGGDRYAELNDKTAWDGNIIGSERRATTEFAGNGSVEAVAMVLPLPTNGEPGRPVVIDIEYTAEPLSGPGEIADHGGELEGQVVRFETDAVGARVSARETLLSVARCGEDAVTVPGVGCVPALADSVVHTGVFFGGSDLVPYAGVSNTLQDVPVTDERGRYKVVGRVISGERVGEEGYALLVYDMERTGNLSISSTDAARTASEALVDRAQRELNTTEQLYGAPITDNGGDQTGTTTPPNTTGPRTTDGNSTTQPADTDGRSQPTTAQTTETAKFSGGGDGGIDFENMGLLAGYISSASGIILLFIGLFVEFIAIAKKYRGPGINPRKERIVDAIPAAGYVFLMTGVLIIGFAEGSPDLLSVAGLMGGVGALAALGGIVYEWL